MKFDFKILVPILVLSFTVAGFASTEFDTRHPGPLGRRAVLKKAESGGLQFGADSIVALYRSEGYLLAEVSAEIETTSQKIIAIFDVKPGPRAIVEKYEITSLYWRSPRLSIREGKNFLPGNLETDMRAIARSFEDTGFPFVKVSLDTFIIGSPKENSLPVKINISVTPGDSVIIGGLIIAGKPKTKKSVVSRLMMLRFPETFSISRIEKGIKRANNSQYISIVGEPEILLDESGVWLIRVQIAESRSANVIGVIGYSPKGREKGFSGNIEAFFGNIWGSGRRIGIKYDESVSHLKLEAKYTEPWFLNSPGDMSFLGRFYKRDSTYSDRKISLDYKLPLDFKYGLSFGVQNRSVYADSFGQYISGIPNSREYALKIGAYREGLYPYANPVGGIDLKISIEPNYIERSGPAFLFDSLDRNESILKIESDIATALEMFRLQVLAIGVHARNIVASGPLPFSERYFLGGWASLRGFREEQFSAENLAWTNIEWRALLGEESHAFVFLDAGLMFPKSAVRQEKFSYGFGLRMPTAIGKISLGYGVEAGENISAGYLHIGLGTGF